VFTLPNGTAGKELHELVINGLPKITGGTEVPLGFQAYETGSFSFRAKEILNMDTLDVILKDKWRKEDFNLRSDAAYHFTSGSSPNTERFSVVFRRSDGTGIPSASEASDNLLAYTNKAGRIIVLLQIANRHGAEETVSVYDVMGRKLAVQTIIVGERAVLDATFPEGVYVVRAGKNTAKIAIR
jgi:hypothetical protein